MRKHSCGRNLCAHSFNFSLINKTSLSSLIFTSDEGDTLGNRGCSINIINYIYNTYRLAANSSNTTVLTRVERPQSSPSEKDTSGPFCLCFAQQGIGDPVWAITYRINSRKLS